MLSRRQRASIGHARRRLFETFGSSRFSHMGQPEIEDCLMLQLPARGYFIEAGANDGVWQSNTYILERYGWDGLLIEPIPSLFEECRRRRRAPVVNCALVGPDHEEGTVPMVYAGLMSIVEGAQGPSDADERHIATGEETQAISRYRVDVPARTLSDVIDGAGNPAIDLLSLDVEGFEHEVLLGLDLRRHRPSLILAESSTTERARQIEEHLSPTYVLIDRPTEIDFLYRAVGADLR